jgi:hypothetical protein
LFWFVIGLGENYSNQNKKNVKMNKLQIYVKWFFGISFVLSGLSSITDSPIVAIPLIILGLFLIPLTLKIIEQKIKYTFTTPVKWAILIGGLFLITYAISVQTAVEDTKIDKIIEDASDLIDEGEFERAKVKIEEAKEKYKSPDNNATKLESEIEKSKSLDFAKE